MNRLIVEVVSTTLVAVTPLNVFLTMVGGFQLQIGEIELLEHLGSALERLAARLAEPVPHRIAPIVVPHSSRGNTGAANGFAGRLLTPPRCSATPLPGGGARGRF